MLGDGFDVAPWQWGLRGDPHAWRAMQEVVATTPTPASSEEVRAAYVAALAQVVGVDIDSSDEEQVRRPELDHGGMSGGMVDLTWWRAKGIPLLVNRAVTRRPTSASGSRAGGLLGTLATWGILVAITAATLGGGVWLLYQRAYGTWAEATVLECESSGGFRRYGSDFRTECVAEWTIDGETVVGGYTGGGGEGDVGKTVDVTVRGDTAYSRSIGLPILLIVLGLPFLALLIVTIRGALRDRRPG